MSGVDAPREKTFLLARPEQRLLEAIARRLPAFVRPDHLTVLALVAAVAFAVAAASGRASWPRRRCSSCTGSATRSTGRSRACGGPSGRATATTSTISPTRSRPRWSASASGCRRTMHLTAGLVLVVAYLALSINSYLETQALGRFSLGYGRLGPTEARLALIALLVGGGARASRSRVLGLTLLDVVALGGAARDGCCAWPRGRAANLRVLRRARALHRAVALGALVLLLGLREHADEQVGERDPHHDRLLERHQDARRRAGRRARSGPSGCRPPTS